MGRIFIGAAPADKKPRPKMSSGTGLCGIGGCAVMPADMKHIIASAFVDMTREKGIDKITVKSLIDACNISRQTFYYHFQNIMEVIE